MPATEDVPPPRDEPTFDAVLQLGIPPEEFEPLRAQFQVDLARLLGIPPDDVDIVSVTRAPEEKTSE